MTGALHIDFETRSTAELRQVGLHNYARHPTTDIWCMAFAFGDEEPELAGRLNPGYQARIIEHVIDGGAVYAHNAPFELEIWNNILVPRWGWPALPPEQTYCTMAMAYAMALPGGLEDAAMALGLDARKDAIGRALMLKYAKPWRTEPLQWMDECPQFTLGGQKWTGREGLQRLGEYCKQDVRVERALTTRLVPLSYDERRVWLMDYAINTRGVKVDAATAQAAIHLAEIAKEKANADISALTNGAVQSVTAVAALKDWLATQGFPIDSLAKQEVFDVLAAAPESLSPIARSALEIRQSAAKSSIAKLVPLVARRDAGDDRVHHILQYHGASTGRWAGRGIQPHNLPRDVPTAAVVEEVFQLVREGKADLLTLLHGAPLNVLSRCLRSFFVADEGHVLIPGDFASVEGRGTAWISGEDWKLKAFREADAGTGPGLYELAYARAFGVPVESIKNPSFERQVGKVMELAFGYGGGVGAFQTMGTTLGVKVSDDDADTFKQRWRRVHARTKKTWYDLQDAAMAAVRVPGSKFTAGVPGRHVTYLKAGSFLWCRLPSGRVLCYPYPKLLEGEYGPQLTFMSVPSPDDRKKGRVIDDPANVANWARVGTWGGTLMENVVQAICRDLLVHVMLRLHDAGARVVLHVHDEVIIEVPDHAAETARATMQQWMREPPEWAKDFPMFAECKPMRRYGK